MLIDFSQLQIQAEDLPSSCLTGFLGDAPGFIRHGEWTALLSGDADLLASDRSQALLHWIGARERRLCCSPLKADRIREPLARLLGRDCLCIPSLLTGEWPVVAIRDPSHPIAETLAFLTPLPPERSGISHYSWALLPHLTRHFRVTVVTQAPCDGLPEGVEAVLTPAQFKATAEEFHHRVYQFGNSDIHLWMLPLLRRYPGLVVLHDFYLSHAMAGLGGDGIRRFYVDHGYAAALLHAADLREADSARAVWAYPCNRGVLQPAAGVVVHSEEAQRLASAFYRPDAFSPWFLIPHLKATRPRSPLDRRSARARLGLSEEAFVVASFGFLGVAKQSLELLQAFLASRLAEDSNVVLVFAGSDGGNGNLRGAMQQALSQAQPGLKARVEVTGWLDTERYQAYLCAADLAVQLRTSSRGESSGTVLDCLATGVPLILNAHGSLAEVPAHCVVQLADRFQQSDLIEALQRLHVDAPRREQLAAAGLRWVEQAHAPELCAESYAVAIRQSSDRLHRQRALLRAAIASSDSPSRTDLANSLAMLGASNSPQPQLLLDVTAMARENLGSGVQRVVAALCAQLLRCPPEGYRVEVVRANDDGPGYRYARAFAGALLNLPSQHWPEQPIQFAAGDVFLGVDLHQHGVIGQASFLQLLRAQGVKVVFVVHDLLPCTLPQCFPDGADQLHQAWLRTVVRMDGALCVSRSVAEELRHWIANQSDLCVNPAFRVDWFHHGADFSAGLRHDSSPELASLARLDSEDAPVLLMVGTIEPRKGYLDALNAFDSLWARDIKFKVIIVGREGWRNLPDSQRRTIPDTVRRLRHHPRLNKDLFWFDQATDSQLRGCYQCADAMVCTSLGEGFGIPLVEAASFNLPLFLRDLAVFREVSKNQASFFPAEASPEQLQEALGTFIHQLQSGCLQEAHAACELSQSWAQSADQVVRALGLSAAKAQDILALEQLEFVASSHAHVSLLSKLKRKLKRLFGFLSVSLGRRERGHSSFLEQLRPDAELWWERLSP